MISKLLVIIYKRIFRIQFSGIIQSEARVLQGIERQFMLPRNYLRMAIFITEPAPGWRSYCIYTAVNDKHQPQNNRAQIELSQMWFQSCLQESNAHAGRDYRHRGDHYTRNSQNPHHACKSQKTTCVNVDRCNRGCIFSFLFV